MLETEVAMNLEGVKELKKVQLTMAIISLVAGIVFIMLPWLLPNGILKVAGFVAVAVGFVMLAVIFTRPKEFVTWRSYMVPIIIIAIGLFTFIQTTETIYLISIGVGIATILKGIGTMFDKYSPLETNQKIILGLISIAVGVLILWLSNSNENIEKVFSYYIGIDLIIQSIIGFYIAVQLNKAMKSVYNEI